MVKYVVEFTKDDLLLGLYFSANKFIQDPFHRQGTSSRADLIGGYFDRWINRAAEHLLLNHILAKEKKQYRVVADFYIYDQKSKKNAPDVLGLIDAKTKKRIVKFSEYIEGSWSHIANMPYIEVKCFKSRDYLVAVREPQMRIGKDEEDSEKNAEHYYVMVESDIREDYLIMLIEELFQRDQELREQITMSDEFIKSDTENRILQPISIENNFNNKVGNFNLIGIFTEDELLKWTKRYGEGEEFLYLADIEEYSTAKRIYNEIEPYEIYSLRNEKFTYKKDEVESLPFQIVGNCKLTILGKGKTTFYFEIENKKKNEELFINQFKLENGRYKGILKNMERKSNWTEYFGYVEFLKEHTGSTNEMPKNSLEQLLTIFDELWESHD